MASYRKCRCQHCGLLIGTSDPDAGILIITAPGVFAEHAGRTIVVHCACGECTTFRGRDVRLRPVAPVDTRKSA